MMLLCGIVQGLMLVSGVRRIESQLMLLPTPAHQPLRLRVVDASRPILYGNESRAAAALAAKAPGVRVIFQGLTERYQGKIAHLVWAAYRGHVDSEINDQYRTIPGARHFLMNIVRYAGCGIFSPQASLVPRWMSAREEFAVCVWPAWFLRARVILAALYLAGFAAGAAGI